MTAHLCGSQVENPHVVLSTVYRTEPGQYDFYLFFSNSCSVTRRWDTTRTSEAKVSNIISD